MTAPNLPPHGASSRYEVQNVAASHPAVVAELNASLTVQGTRPGLSYAEWAAGNPLLADPFGDAFFDLAARVLPGRDAVQRQASIKPFVRRGTRFSRALFETLHQSFADRFFIHTLRRQILWGGKCHGTRLYRIVVQLAHAGHDPVMNSARTDKEKTFRAKRLPSQNVAFCD